MAGNVIAGTTSFTFPDARRRRVDDGIAVD